jgi:hypothetical protein
MTHALESLQALPDTQDAIAAGSWRCK